MEIGIFKDLKGAKITADALAEVIAAAIAQGLMRSGEKLPSTRDLALYLNVSRTTVMKGLDTLIATGHLEASQGSGVWVADHSTPVERSPSAQKRYNWSDRYSLLASGLNASSREATEDSQFDELNFGSSKNEFVPIAAWRRSMLQHSKMLEETPFAANKEVFGYRPLRAAIADFLRRTKQINCRPEQVVVGSGVQTVISQALTLLVKPGDAVICDEPGFYGAREQFLSIGAKIISVPVDEEGLMTSHLPTDGIPAQWIYIAPSCQEPTGVSLSQTRREELISWCNQNGVAILEDDWDSEFHYQGPSAKPLFALDNKGSVIYFCSFWRLLYPLISVSFLVLPEELVEVFSSYKNSWDRQFTLIEHLVLTDLLNEGHIEKSLRAMWKSHRKSRQALVFALKSIFKSKVQIIQSSTGMHVVARFDPEIKTADIQSAAQSASLLSASTAPYYSGQPRTNEFMLRFADLPVDEVEARVDSFAKQLFSMQNPAK